MKYFIRTYKTFTLTRPYLRAAFGGDVGELVRTFFEANQEAFTNGIETARHWARYRSEQLLYNTLDRVEQPWIKQLKALVEFEFDRITAFRSKTDCTTIKEYAFCYADLKQRRPIAEFSEGTSKLLLQKKDGKVSLMMLKRFEEAIPWLQKASEDGCLASQKNIENINTEYEWEAQQKKKANTYTRVFFLPQLNKKPACKNVFSYIQSTLVSPWEDTKGKGTAMPSRTPEAWLVILS